MFDKLNDLKNMGGMLKQALEIKQRMESLKESLGDERVEASAGGGMVKVQFNGKMELLSLEIDPEIANSGDAGMIQTLVQAAVNEGIQRTQDLVKSKMSQMTQGIDIPGITS